MTINKNNSESGQTIIETIIAIAVLLTALTSGLAMTIYVFSHASINQNEIVATYLAREGTDILRNMRDTNWLESEKKDVGPWKLQACTIGADQFNCYGRVWQGVPGNGFHNYQLADGAYRLEFDDTNRTWSLGNSSNYALYLQPNGSYTHTVSASTQKFYRQIVLTHNTDPPYASDVSDDLSELKVTSIVAWTDRNCQPIIGNDLTTTNCKVQIEARLTNWKDY